ncbi:MAG: hypothetical protein H7Z37_04305 [Pyrinomonadaceae bacterium]|nr:hypothetical protein [Pyrinomonadaceae bacterium]
MKKYYGEKKPSEIFFDFDGFRMTKDWVAEFEIINDTAEPIYYDTCSTEFKSDERRVAANDYSCIEGRKELTLLKSGERATIYFEKQSVKDALYARELEPKVSAQVGIEVLVGTEKQRRRLWSVQKFTFPEELEFPRSEE